MTKFDDKRIESYIDKKFLEMENSLTKACEASQPKQNTTYSEMLKKETQDELKTIIRVAKIEEKKEERDHDQRKSNIIIHGATEGDSKTKEEQDKDDKDFVEKLLKDASYKATPKYIGRIGFKTGERSRPLKVAFSTEKEKRNLFGNLKALKGIKSYEGVSISDDYTRAERDMIKTWSNQAKEKNNMEPNNSNIIWRVRGNPKSGFMLRKFAKAPPINHDD